MFAEQVGVYNLVCITYQAQLAKKDSDNLQSQWRFR